jgi:hypothetical protein
MAKEIKADTQEILNDTSTIKQDTTQILAEIIRLQAQLPRDLNLNNASGFMLERYLDNLTSYAESVCDTFPDAIVTPIDDEREVLVVSEPKAISPGGPRLHPGPESDDAAVLHIEYPSISESAFGMQHIRENSDGSDEWQRTSEERNYDRLINNPYKSTSPIVAIGGGLQNYDSDEVDTSLPGMEYSQLQEYTQPCPPPQENVDQPLVDLIILKQGLVPLQDTETGDPKYKKEEEVQLFRGNLVLDCAVPERILSQVPHAEPPERDEFTHVRYTALTCHPSRFSNLGFALRPSLFGKPRSTQIFVTLSISHSDLKSPAKHAAFARTLRSTIQSVSTRASEPCAWKDVVIGIITDGTVEIETLSVLEQMGVYWNNYKKISVNGVDVRSHLYEVCHTFPQWL